MKTKNIKINTTKEHLKLINSNNKFKELKSDFFLKILFHIIIPKGISLETIKYNKYIQKRINININNYKDYSENYSLIEIEIIPKRNKYGKFIKIKEEDIKYYHIYFNNNKKEEIKRNYINKNEKVSKINIIIDYQVKSFNQLFTLCHYIESINFKKFHRNNITDMSDMFSECSLLKELNLSNFNTNNVTNMSFMFAGCSLLKKLNLNNFNINNVNDMSYMFAGCSSLKELNLSNFNTDNVTNMAGLFAGCSSLKELNLSNFNTNNVTNMSYMFDECLDELKLKIKNQFKNFRKEAFYNLIKI